MKKDNTACPRLGKVGGQAVIEGVMMKAGEEVVTSCRTPSGKIKVYKDKFVPLHKKYKILGIPVLRGAVSFVETMKLSMKTLNVSAEATGVQEEAKETKADKWLKKHIGISTMDIVMSLSVVLGVVLALGLFIFLPSLAAKGINHLTNDALGQFWVAFCEGILKIAIFILYIFGVSFMPDIRRTFEYHGAEHKSIACYEAGEELTPENAKKYTRFHPRCGTSFMFVMLIIGIIISFFIKFSNPFLRTGIKLLLLPIVVGVGYEFIMFAGKHPNPVTRVLSAPGLWMQRLTTREPDSSQLEVAITSLKLALHDEFPDFISPDNDSSDEVEAGESADGEGADGSVEASAEGDSKEVAVGATDKDPVKASPCASEQCHDAE